MNEYYTRQQAMEKLHLMSTNAFLQLTRKYPEIFVNMNPGNNKAKNPWYDKATVDNFAKTRDYYKQEKP
jgi:hypothetical protein